MTKLRSRNAAFAAYGVLLVLPTLVFGWLYWRTLERDYQEQLSAAPDAAAETAELFVESLRERVDAILAREDHRPFSHYADAFAPEDAIGEELYIQSSPLEREPLPEGVLGWFSYDRLEWPSGDVRVFAGAGPDPAARELRRAVIERSALVLREQSEAAGNAVRATQYRTPESRAVPAQVLAVMLIGDKAYGCVAKHQALMRGWKPDVDVSDFHLELYHEPGPEAGADGPLRAVATRRVIMPPEYHPNHQPDQPIDAPCLAPLNEGLALQQGFFLDLDWLLGELVDEVGAQTLRESERLIKVGRDPALDQTCEVCVEVQPIRELGFATSEPSDAQLGMVQVAVNTEAIHARFRRQRTFFGGMAAMMILVLMSGMVLIERSVSRDLEQAERTQNFVSAVTHELRTPLASIRLYGEMLLEGWTHDPDQIREYHRRILRETNRLSTLVERVLQKGRLTSGPMAAEPIDLNALVLELREELAAAHPPGSPYAGGDDDLAFDLEPGLPPVLATREAIQGILSNLVENARKYAPVEAARPGAGAPERIVVRTRREGGRAVLEVLDRGPGIPAADRDRVFEAFHRLGNEATRTATGTGLGLHLVRLQAESVGAEAAALPREGGGSRFRVRFRLADDAVQAP